MCNRLSPRCLVHVADVYDVVEALKFAQDNSLKTAAYGAGHQVVGVSLLPNAVVIDTKNLTAVDVHPTAEIAYVQAGMAQVSNQNISVISLLLTQMCLDILMTDM